MAVVAWWQSCGLNNSENLKFLISFILCVKVSIQVVMAGAAGPSVEAAAVEEDAAELRFPKEFELGVTKILLISEVNILLEHRKQQNESQEEEQELSEVFMKTLNYTQRFSKFKNMENIAAVRSLLTIKKIHKFELAALVRTIFYLRNS